MTPRLESVYFAGQQIPHWTLLARVLAQSAAVHCPGWPVHVTHIDPPALPSARGGNAPRTYTSNTQKLEQWASIVAGAADGERILLIDTDTVILRPLEDIWDRPFDVAYTVAERFPINGGVVFVRVSDRSRAFLAAWAEDNRRLYDHPAQLPQIRAAYGGINQASFCVLKDSGRIVADLLPLPCAEWNCESSTWAKFDPQVTRILHVKSALRLSCMGPFLTPGLEAPVAAWKAMARLASREAVEA